MSDEELIARLRALGRDFDDWDTAADRIEALLNLNEALVELMDDRDAKLAKAVDALRGFMSKVDTACLVERDHPQAEFADAWRDAYAIIAEIEGEKG